MAIRLYINYDTENYLARADLYPDETIVLKKQIIGQTGLDNTNKQFTKEFMLPASSQNNRLFNHYELKSNESAIHPNRKIPARIEIDNIYVITGSLEMLSVTWKARQPESYKVVFYSDASNLKAVIGDQLLDECNWDEFVFNITKPNVMASWDQANDTNYFVPVMSWSRWFKQFYYPDTDNVDNIGNVNYGIKMAELRIGIKLIDMVSAIGKSQTPELTFTFEGYISDFLQEAFIIPSKFADTYGTVGVEAFYTDVQTAPGTSLIAQDGVFSTVILDQINFDPQVRWSGSAQYTAQFSGPYLFNFYFLNDTQAKIDVRMHDLTDDNYSLEFSSGNTNEGDIEISWDLIVGHEYEFEWQSNKNNVNSELLQLTTLNVPASIIGQDWVPNNAMPAVKTIDFLASFLKAFNLVIYETDIDQFTIVDVRTLYREGEYFDFEDYVDETLLTYEKVVANDVIDMKHLEGKDAPNTVFTELNGREYGELKVYPDVDFSDGELKQESIFTVFPPTYMDLYASDGEKIGKTDMLHHFQLTSDDPPKTILAEFIILYRNPQIETGFPYYLQEGNNPDGSPDFGTAIDLYSGYSQVQDVPSLESSRTLCYSAESVAFGTTAHETITNTFFLDWILQLYKKTAYTLEVSFPISFGVYLKITSLSILYLNGFYHFIASWSYETNTGRITLKLLRYDYVEIEDLYVVKDTIQTTFEGEDNWITFNSRSEIQQADYTEKNGIGKLKM